MKHNYSDYMNDTKKLFTKLFGEKIIKKLDNTPFNPIEWDGIDIDDTIEITATTPNIKDRFTESWGEYFTERDCTMFDLFLSSVFHYGYQQKCDMIENEKPKYDTSLNNALLKVIDVLNEKNKTLQKEIETLKNKQI